MLPPPQPGVLHACSGYPQVHAFEFAPSSPPSSSLVLIVGGLSDTLLSIPYLQRLAKGLGQHSWGLAQATLRSAGGAWGGSSVKQDAQELATIVRYFREQGRDRIVLMGFSTGTQDAISYIHLQRGDPASFPPLAGIILQAPVSDREIVEVALPHILPQNNPQPADLDLSSYIPSAWSNEWPINSGITWQRYLSLVSKPTLDDINLEESEDFFSSDLSDARLENVFAPLSCPLLALLSGNDSSYPDSVKAKLPELLERFKRATPGGKWSPLSGIVEGASHDVSQEGSAEVLVQKVVDFVRGL
ncbi:hypothetical protein JCM11641_004123 [Rhodosporidiobolus odoratus]